MNKQAYILQGDVATHFCFLKHFNKLSQARKNHSQAYHANTKKLPASCTFTTTHTRCTIYITNHKIRNHRRSQVFLSLDTQIYHHSSYYLQDILQTHSHTILPSRDYAYDNTRNSEE